MSASVADHEQWYWAVAKDIKCVGHWMRQINDSDALIPELFTSKRYASAETQAAMDKYGSFYVTFAAEPDDIKWGKTVTAEVVHAFLHDGLPHESEWTK